MIILTGAAGFIGSCFLWKLNSQGIRDIIAVDNLDNPDKWRNLLGKRLRDYIQKDDFLSFLEKRKLPKASHIIHMGACSSTLITDSAYLLSNNYEYSKKLAQWAFAHNSKFIYASSAATYGDGQLGYDDSNENTYRLKPLNMYGYSKQLFDFWVLNNGHEGKVTGLKFFNVFGPNEYHKEEMRSVICKNFSQVKNGKPMYLFKSCRQDYEDGEQKRDFIYVKDAVEVIYYFFSNPGKTGIFNLGSGLARSWNDLAKAMFSALGGIPKIEYIDMPETIKAKYQYFTEAKIDKLRSAGCRHLFRSLEASIADYVGYLKENANL